MTDFNICEYFIIAIKLLRGAEQIDGKAKT
jgi:hypothetical protein